MRGLTQGKSESQPKRTRPSVLEIPMTEMRKAASSTEIPSCIIGIGESAGQSQTNTAAISQWHLKWFNPNQTDTAGDRHPPEGGGGF